MRSVLLVVAALQRPAPEVMKQDHLRSAVAVGAGGHLESLAQGSFTSSPNDGSAIPKKIFFSSQYATLDKLPAPVQANVRQLEEMNPGYEVVWYDDEACKQLLEAGGRDDVGLLVLFNRVNKGAFKSDICRTAYLAKYGGWYFDLDVSLRVPLDDLASPTTTFVSAWNEGNSQVFNAILGARPASPIMLEAKAWFGTDEAYVGCQRDHALLCGTEAMRQGLERFFARTNAAPPSKDDPPDIDHDGESVRMFHETDMQNPIRTPETAVPGDTLLYDQAGDGGWAAAKVIAATSNELAIQDKTSGDRAVVARNSLQLKAAAGLVDSSLLKEALTVAEDERDRLVPHYKEEVSEMADATRDHTHKVRPESFHFRGLDYCMVYMDSKKPLVVGFSRFAGCSTWGCQQGSSASDFFSEESEADGYLAADDDDGYVGSDLEQRITAMNKGAAEKLREIRNQRRNHDIAD